MSIVALTVGFYAIQWNRGMYLGKTPEQIVAMGRSKWHELHSKKRGLSSADMVAAENMYGDALQNLNDRALAKQSPTRRKWLLEARTTSRAFGQNAHQVGYVLTGGGTMWNLFDSSIHPDVEQFIADSISNKKVPAVKMKSFDSLYKEVDESYARCEFIKPDSAMYKEEEVKRLNKHMTDLRARQKIVDRLIATGKPDDALRFRMYISRKITVASGADLQD